MDLIMAKEYTIYEIEKFKDDINYYQRKKKKMSTSGIILLIISIVMLFAGIILLISFVNEVINNDADVSVVILYIFSIFLLIFSSLGIIGSLALIIVSQTAIENKIRNRQRIVNGYEIDHNQYQQ